MKTLLACLLALVLLMQPATASAAYAPVDSGKTTITLTKPFLSLLGRNGVEIHALAGARRSGGRLVFPAVGGTVDPSLQAGSIDTEGTLVFSAGRRKLPFRALIFKSKRAPLYAKVGGGQLKLAASAGLKGRRSGFGCEFSATGLRITAKVAQRLNKKLRLGKAIQPGLLIGRVTATAQPATVRLQPTSGLTLAADPGFTGKLNDLFVSMNPIAPAELRPGPTLTFPVGSESTLAPDGNSGIVKLEGSVELLQLGKAQYLWRELWLEPDLSAFAAETDLEPSPPQVGKSPQAPLLALTPGGTVISNPNSRTIAISGQPAALTAATADSLNRAFAEGKPIFRAGETVGLLTLTAIAE